LQLADPSTIAELTGITTVADFRARDIAAGGQGAPLAPALHAHLWGSDEEATAVLNLGGFANLTLMAPGRSILGFDTGPANALLDRWAERHLSTRYDDGGAFAASGRADPALLEQLLAHPYLQRPTPKSTGHEEFHLAWLDEVLAHLGNRPSPADVQATLLELTVRSISEALEREAPETVRLIACGGGVHNRQLMERLQQSVAPRTVETSAAHGVDPDFVEAIAFAWLAHRTLSGLAGNLPSVTGARRPVPLGGIYPAG
jgi:anhydro-N-acetylmuramic acid kinase